ncbi:MAG: hypothetical protein AAFR66_05995, partial [Bacteroidota bacterium]
RMRLFKYHLELKEIKYSSSLFSKRPDFILKEFFVGTNKDGFSIEVFQKQHLMEMVKIFKKNHLNSLYKGFWVIKEDDVEVIIGKKEIGEISVILHDVFVKSRNKFYPVDSVTATVELWIDHSEEELQDSRTFRSITLQKVLANFVLKEIEMQDGDIGQLFIVEDGDDLKFSFVRDEETIDLANLGTFRNLNIVNG